MYDISVDSKIMKYTFKSGEKLLETLQENGINFESPCNGKGICGKCKIQILQGVVSEPTEEECKHLTPQELEQGFRLACSAEPKSDLVIKLKDHKIIGHKILTEGMMPEFEFNPTIFKKVYTIQKPKLEDNQSYEELLTSVLHAQLSDDNINILKNLPEIYQNNLFTAIYSGNKVIGIEAGDTTRQTYGLAVDIGTTTVVISLVDLSIGQEIAVESSINPQKEYGLDVLSRIDFVSKKKHGVELLQNSIINCLNELITKLCSKCNIASDNIYEITVAANATMMHLFLGIHPGSIGRAPYAPVFSGSQNFPAASLGLKCSTNARVYCLPGVSGYIGADIVAGVQVAQLSQIQKNILFIDIGTNGEIVLSKRGELSSCSCAAGPALEGMNISCGMRAADGAIEGVEIKDNEIRLKVIGGSEPAGICGSGIFDAVSELLRVKLLGKTGRLKKAADLEGDENAGLARFLAEINGKREVLLNSTSDLITVTQGDIRQVQLAKGAILSGFFALLDVMEIKMQDLDEVIIAGQFGRHLKVESLIKVGIIPEELGGKVRYIGNSSKTGALMCLLSREIRKEMEQVVKQIRYYELSTKPGYEKLFTKCLYFSQ